MPRIGIRTPCRPTESLPKVKIAVLNLFPDARFLREDEVVEAAADSVETLRERIRGQKIRDSARRALLAGRSEERIIFALNKQAAYVGKVSFSAGSPLGDIEVAIESDDPEGLVDGIAESTTRPPPEPLG